jgi:hypothetical protein
MLLVEKAGGVDGGWEFFEKKYFLDEDGSGTAAEGKL